MRLLSVGRAQEPARLPLPLYDAVAGPHAMLLFPVCLVRVLAGCARLRSTTACRQDAVFHAVFRCATRPPPRDTSKSRGPVTLHVKTGRKQLWDLPYPRVGGR